MIVKGSNTTFFKWRDKKGCVWVVSRHQQQTMVHWRAATPQLRGTGEADVKAFEIGSLRPMRIARLMDVVVDREVQGRGVGSMLIEAAMNDCQRLGSIGMDGKISSVDEDHFPKLKHIYEKLGFSFVLFDSDQLNGRSNTVGGIEIRFDD